MNVSKIVSRVLQLIERRIERTPQFQAIRKVEVNLHKDAKNGQYPQARINCIPLDKVHLHFYGEESFVLLLGFLQVREL